MNRRNNIHLLTNSSFHRAIRDTGGNFVEVIELYDHGDHHVVRRCERIDFEELNMAGQLTLLEEYSTDDAPVYYTASKPRAIETNVAKWAQEVG